MRGWILLLATASACSHPVPAADLPTTLAAYEREVRERVRGSDAPFLHVGHRAGNVAEYAKQIAGTRIAPTGAKDVVLLMREAFDSGLDGIEIDVQAGPDDDIYVVHDPIGPPPPNWAGRRFLTNNTLATVLAAFVNLGYAAKGKRLFIELKAPFGCIAGPAAVMAAHRQIAARTVDVVAMRVRQASPTLAGALAFVSFNPFMLEAAHARAQARGVGGLGYYAILTSDGALCPAICGVARLPCFDAEAARFLRETPWLSGVWLAPKHMRTWASRLAQANAGRAARLSIMLSTYQSHRDDFFDEVGHTESRDVTGLIYDVARARP